MQGKVMQGNCIKFYENTHHVKLYASILLVLRMTHALHLAIKLLLLLLLILVICTQGSTIKQNITLYVGLHKKHKNYNNRLRNGWMFLLSELDKRYYC